MICYDREFPESAHILMLKGAELILVPNACPMEINRLAQLRRYRECEVHGNAYRRPSKYNILTSTEILPPFVRNDYRKRL